MPAVSKRARKPATARRGLRRRLRKAQRRRDLVTLPRRHDGQDPPVEGFVVGSSKAWVLLARVSDGLEPDGWTAVRVKDLRGLRVRPGAAGLTGRALKARGQWPPVAPRRVDLSEVAALVRSVDARTPLFTVHVERDRPDALWLGVADRLTRRALRLRTVGPRAKWAGHQDFWLKDLTRIDFGTTYAEAVHLVGGDAPGRRLTA
jgi:hypothetical protein